MQQPAPLRAPTSLPHDFAVLPKSEVSLAEAKLEKKTARKTNKETRRTIASIRKKSSTTNPKGLSDQTHMALKYLSKSTPHLLLMQCFLTSKGQEPPEGFSTPAQLRKAVKHYKDNVLPLRTELASEIREHNSAVAKEAPVQVLNRMKDRVAQLEEEIRSASVNKLPRWAGCAVKPTVCLVLPSLRSTEDRAEDLMGVAMHTGSK